VDNPQAFRGNYASLDSGEFFTYDGHTSGGGTCRFELIGPRTSVWTVSVEVNDVPYPVITSDGTGGQREVLFSHVFTSADCSATYEFAVTDGASFGVDAVLG
jgi:hypothetical protein